MKKNINPGEYNKRITLITNKAVGTEIITVNKQVWSNVESVKRSEISLSYQSDYIPQIVFVIRTTAYELTKYIDGDGVLRHATQVDYKGQKYTISREYSKDGVTELICS